MHAEWGVVSDAATASGSTGCAAGGGRIVAVGTTSLRLLESAAAEDGTIRSFAGETSIFITPGYRFRAVDLLMTNFHLPRSTLFMLVVGLFRAGDDAGRVHACGRDGVSVLFLRRRVPALSGGGAVTPGVTFAHPRDRRRGAHRRCSTMPRGTIRTPAFMPVGTQATVKAMYPEQVRALGADIILGNTYHLMLRPGAERVARARRAARLRNWPWPILTDSGGFQVMSLASAPPDRRGRRHLPLAYRRLRASADAGAIDRDPGAARFRHRDAARRMRGAARGSRGDREGDAPLAPLGGAVEGRVRRKPRGGRCSASSRVATSRSSACNRPRGSRQSASTATRSAGWRWASRRRRCSR